MSIGANTLNTELTRGHATFMRQLADMWLWVRDLEKKSTEGRTDDERESKGNNQKVEG